MKAKRMLTLVLNAYITQSLRLQELLKFMSLTNLKNNAKLESVLKIKRPKLEMTMKKLTQS